MRQDLAREKAWGSDKVVELNLSTKDLRKAVNEAVFQRRLKEEAEAKASRLKAEASALRDKMVEMEVDEDEVTRRLAFGEAVAELHEARGAN